MKRREFVKAVPLTALAPAAVTIGQVETAAAATLADFTVPATQLPRLLPAAPPVTITSSALGFFDLGTGTKSYPKMVHLSPFSRKV